MNYWNTIFIPWITLRIGQEILGGSKTTSVLVYYINGPVFGIQAKTMACPKMGDAGDALKWQYDWSRSNQDLQRFHHQEWGWGDEMTIAWTGSKVMAAAPEKDHFCRQNVRNLCLGLDGPRILDNYCQVAMLNLELTCLDHMISGWWFGTWTLWLSIYCE